MSRMVKSPPTIYILSLIKLGWEYDLNSTKLAYDLLKELDPYHPVSLVLNCQNFCYEEYSSGADIVFEEAGFSVPQVSCLMPRYLIPCPNVSGRHR